MFVAKALHLSLLLVWLVQFPADSEGARDTTYVKPRPTTTPKPDFYARKLKAYFSGTDANKDGFISRKDYTELADRFIDLVDLCKREAKILLYKKVPRIYRTFYHDREQRGDPAKLDEVIATMKERRCDPEFNISAERFVSQEFSIIDLDDDQVLDETEHTIYLCVRGVDEKDAPKSHAAIDTNRDGVVELEEFVEGAKSFFNTENENCPSRWFYGPVD